MFSRSTTLAEARTTLRKFLRTGKATNCPCCGQHTKIYKRTIHSTMARALILAYKAGGAEDFIHVPSLDHSGAVNELNKTRYWGLLEESPQRRADGGRAGWWKLTPKGVDFIEGRITLPKYAVVYDGKLLELEGDQVGIAQALSKKFNYAELMAA